MNWLNIDIAVLRSTEFIGADPIARATWLCLMGYCADQENGGVIPDCESWGDRRWMQTCAVTRAEIDASHPLAFWDASALHVAFYPLHQEKKVTINRTNGLKGGRPNGKTELKPDGKPIENHVVQVGVNVKESNSNSNSKEKEGNILPTPSGDGDKPKEEKQKKDRKPRERNPLIDAIASLEGDLSQLNKSAWGRCAKALSDIQSVCQDLTVDEIQRRSRNYKTHFNGAILSATALAKHWARCDKQADIKQSEQKPNTFLDQPDYWAMKEAKQKELEKHGL